MSSRSLLDAMRPCGRFVVAGTGLEAAVQDAHEPVGELPQRGIVFGAPGFELVVVGTSARRGVQCTEGLGHEAWVMRASMSRSWCTHRAITTFFLPEARVIGGGTGVVLTRPGVGVAVGVVPELGEHPGTEDGSQTGLGQNDLSVDGAGHNAHRPAPAEP